ncbi:ABC transporter substrate-binding protein [Falsiroseomonas sp. HW251]|uniref:ABC transporter substrate-binding protein n=1 Tax=Falsiroseomonas sp. HW251 TaxID=3390998 RepID=UPI003D3126E6
MKRRDLMRGAAAATAALVAPCLAAAQGSRALRFVPHTELVVLDPTWSNPLVTRNHAFLVFDTLFGQDDAYRARPQMLEGFVVENDGLRWMLTLREGLRFHDGERVLARDAVASIRRWSRRDPFGQALMAATDELSAPDDRTIVFRLKKPFPLLPDALGKTSAMMPAIMPARLAEGDPNRAVPELVGSGPFRFKADERLAGDRAVYERFAAYVPNPNGPTQGTAGPKVAHFDRIEWKMMPDASTAASALRTGEVDWWEMPPPDNLPLLRRSRGIVVDMIDPTGQIPTFRINHLHPPFDNSAIRRALLGAVDQRDVVMAIAGDDRDLWRTGVGFFTPGSPLASDDGLEALRVRPPEQVRRDLLAAGYDGTPVLFMVSADSPMNNATGQVVADAFRRCGLNIDYTALDFGTVVQRRLKPEPVAQGGWNGYCSGASGIEQMLPATHLMLRGNGMTGPNIGWPTSAEIERLRAAWFDAPDLPAQQVLARQLQSQALIDVPYVPLGQVLQPSAYRSDIKDVLRGMPLFWNVRRG